jgi:outer membrane biosynthesis protein TonB
MASTERIFFAGVATSVLLIGAGFGGGVMLGKTALDIPQTKVAQTKAASLEKPPPPARVVLQAVTEAAPTPPEPTPVPPIQAALPTAPEPQARPQPEPQVLSAIHVQHDIEKEKQAEHQAEADKQRAERAEQRKKTAERERQRRFVERKVRQEAAREQQQEHQQQEQQEVSTQRVPLGILTFDGGDNPSRQNGFFSD